MLQYIYIYIDTITPAANTKQNKQRNAQNTKRETQSAKRNAQKHNAQNKSTTQKTGEH